ncbi:MAG: hypothetical protein II723_03385 [Oscillospiraceae bacterium]|nr:hypothetical protein [Oscillospiraceae bacterium]
MKPLVCLLAMLPAGLLLTGCRDIRNRLSPDVLAVDAGIRTRFAAHISQDAAVLSASADSPLLMPDALQTASGAEIEAGHLSLLAVSGSPCAFLRDYADRQWLAPTCQVLYVPASACDALSGGQLPSAQQIAAAVAAGQIPCRTADAVLSDLLGGSGITAVCCLRQDAVSLILADDSGTLDPLPDSACRGLALLGKRWDTFSFAISGGICTVTQLRARIHAAEDSQQQLTFTLDAAVTCRTGAPAAAEAVLRQMLLDALTETAQKAGADLLLLREAAVRDGISDAGSCAASDWQQRLRSAVYRAEIRLKTDAF